MANPPIKKFKLNSMEIAIWANEYGLSFNMTKRYCDKSGKWRDSPFFNAHDLPTASSLCNVALSHIFEVEELAKQIKGDNAAALKQNLEKAADALDNAPDFNSDDDIQF